MLSRDPKWPPDYAGIIDWRRDMLVKMRQPGEFGRRARQAFYDGYRDDPVQFISDWVDTVDPRNAANPDLMVRMPFVLFQRQKELVQFFHACLESEAHGLVEKSRDMGATWAALSYAVWLWLFRPGSSVGFGSRKAMYVDKIGDMDSIFEKLRALVRGLPPEFMPARYEGAYMKLVNFDFDSSITGESGDSIGRGGRKLVYFKDESSHYEHPELIESALSENTRVQIDMSSVNGIGNVFHRRRESGTDWEPGMVMTRGQTYVFIMDWRDNPAKTQEWYEQRRAKFTDEGLLHIFKQEVDRDYAASLVNAIILREWITSAIDAHKKLPEIATGKYVAGLDVADGGNDRNALARRKGGVLEYLELWGERDTGTTARRCVDAVSKFLPIDVMYDCVGVGSGVKAEVNRLRDEKLLPREARFHAWDAGAAAKDPKEPVIKGDPQSPTNEDHYANLKAQGWFELRRRLERTHLAITRGNKYRPEQLISISSDLPMLRQLEKELLQPTSGLSSNMRVIIDKVPDGARSPNLADAVMMCYHPVKNVGMITDLKAWM